MRGSGQGVDMRGDKGEDLTYYNLDTWSVQPTSRDLVAALELRRQRFGWQIDFEDFKLPFLQNVMTKTAALS